MLGTYQLPQVYHLVPSFPVDRGPHLTLVDHDLLRDQLNLLVQVLLQNQEVRRFLFHLLHQGNLNRSQMRSQSGVCKKQIGMSVDKIMKT